MQPEMYTYLAKKQDTYWWNRARRSMGEALLRRYGAPRRGRWLDLGCGTGGNLGIADDFQAEMVIGTDLSELALDLAQAKFPQARLVRADISGGLPFADSSFDVVTVFGLICHHWVKSDRAALTEVRRILRPGGMMLITEPAFPILSREWDKAVMAARRYRRGELVALCRQAGLMPRFASYFTSFGFPILLGLRAFSRLSSMFSRKAAPPDDAGAEGKPLPAWLNGTLHAAAAVEGKAIAAGLPMPFGVTLVLVAARD
jgi:SAM-dependent methyltransferase